MTDHKEFRASGQGLRVVRVVMGAETLGVSGSSSLSSGVEAFQNLNSLGRSHQCIPSQVNELSEGEGGEKKRRKEDLG